MPKKKLPNKKVVKSSPINLSPENLQKKKIMEFDIECHATKHKWKMKEFEYLRESQRIHHEQEKERQRIKTAEIRKAHERKERSIMYQNG